MVTMVKENRTLEPRSVPLEPEAATQRMDELITRRDHTIVERRGVNAALVASSPNSEFRQDNRHDEQ